MRRSMIDRQLLLREKELREGLEYRQRQLWEIQQRYDAELKVIQDQIYAQQRVLEVLLDTHPELRTYRRV